MISSSYWTFNYILISYVTPATNEHSQFLCVYVLECAFYGAAVGRRKPCDDLEQELGLEHRETN